MNAFRTAKLSLRTGAGRGELLLVAALTAVAAFLRLYRVGDKSIWLDEGFSIWIARHSLWEGWRWLIEIDQHPPLYYSLLHIWIEMFGDIEPVVRMFSAACSTLAAPVFYAAARRLLGRTTAAIGLTILATSPFHVQFGQETRMYALLTLEVACVLYFLARLVTQERPCAPVWLGLSVSQALVMLTHNTAAVYLPVALNAAMGILFVGSAFRTGAGDEHAGGKRRAAADAAEGAGGRPQGCEAGGETVEPGAFWVSWIRYQLLAVLLWLPWAAPFVIQAIDVEKGFWLPPPWPDLVLDTFRNFHFAFLPTDLPLRPLWMWGYAALATVGVARLMLPRLLPEGEPAWTERTRTTQGLSQGYWGAGSRTAVLLCLFALPHALALLVSTHRPIYAERPLIWTTLPYVLLIAAGIRVLASWAAAPFSAGRLERSGNGPALRGARALSRSAAAGWLAAAPVMFAILLLSGLSLNGYYFFFQKEGWDKAAAHVAQRTEPGDVIVFNATWVQIPFEYYYARHGLPTELKGLPVDLFERGELEPRMGESDVPRIDQLLSGRDRVWLVYSHNWYSDPEGIIPRELGKVLQEKGRDQFPGIQVFRYERRH